MSVGLGGRRKARLSIPRVGQARNLTGQAGLGQAHPTTTKTSATTPAQPGNTAAGAPGASGDPFQTAATAAPGAGPRFAIPSWSPSKPGEADPRDANYWSQLAKLKFTDEQQDRELGEAQGKSDLDYADAARTALRNRMVQQRGLGENAMRGNLGASGWLNRNEAEQTAQYAQEREHAALSKEQEDQGRAAAKHALEAGWSIDAAALLAEAVGRYAGSAAGEAEDGELETAGGGGGGKATGTFETGKFPFYPTMGGLPMNQHKKKGGGGGGGKRGRGR